MTVLPNYKYVVSENHVPCACSKNELAGGANRSCTISRITICLLEKCLKLRGKEQHQITLQLAQLVLLFFSRNMTQEYPRGPYHPPSIWWCQTAAAQCVSTAPHRVHRTAAAASGCGIAATKRGRQWRPAGTGCLTAKRTYLTVSHVGRKYIRMLMKNINNFGTQLSLTILKHVII